MSSFAKAKLKAAREALGKKQYEIAREAASQVLDYEPDNYNAHVFLGLASLELNQYEKSEQFYRKAIELNSDQILAWQGISRLYERHEQWSKLTDTLLNLMDRFARSNDATKCAETLQKYIELCRDQGTREQIISSLSLLLPESPYYPVLSALPPPDPTSPTASSTHVTQIALLDSLPTLQEIITLTEKQEETTIKSEFDKRRTRLGAPPPDQLKKEVEREVWGVSKARIICLLLTLYNEVLNHPNTPDELRRDVESRLIRHKQQYFYALSLSGASAAKKAEVGAELDGLVGGIVAISVPDELAWSLFLEGKDSSTLGKFIAFSFTIYIRLLIFLAEGYGYEYLKTYIQLFAGKPLARLLEGYFAYNLINLSNEEDDEVEDTGDDSEEDPYDTILDAFTLLPDSIVANRIVADTYLQELDYTSAIRVAESGLELVQRHESNTGRKLVQVRKAFNVILGTSLVHLFPPKHHSRALSILDDVLAQDPNDLDCLMGRGYILEFAERWDEAGELFAKADELSPDDLAKGLRAKEEHAWCLRKNDLDHSTVSLKGVLDTLESLEGRDQDKARCLWRIGQCYWAMGAFELDPREADAARRLAEGFADEREWDLVEVVARRTIEGEGGLDAGMKSDDAVIAGRYLPTNAWAWKAVGSVELARRNYSAAIQAFQVALRAIPDDQLSWVRLGEAYSKAGRHAAALRALIHARELREDDWICTYLIGEVQRQTAQFQDALLSFQSILDERPSEIVVLMAVAQTHLDLGREERTTGFLSRAEESFVACIWVALRAVEESSGYRSVAWKTAADAIFSLSKHTSFTDVESVRDVLNEVLLSVKPHTSSRLTGILVPASIELDVPLNGLRALEVAIAAYDYRLSLGSTEGAAAGSSWFDLGIALNCWSVHCPSEAQEKVTVQANTCLMQALQEEPANPTYWNTLGALNFIAKPKTAQHAYIKSLEIDSKSVITWTNLGLLYLYRNDLELANEALYRAQTLDPDYTTAWVGQALVATANGHETDARALLEHTVTLTTDLPEADLLYATRVFSATNNASSVPSYDTFSPVFFVLDRYTKRRTDDVSAQHLFGLVCERLGQLELGADLLGRAITLLEAAYEESEDQVVERQFVIAHSNLARIRLGLHDASGALESFESALGLLPEDDAGQGETMILRVHAQFGCGLARFAMGELQEALEAFQGALDTAGEDALLRGHVSVLLAQTMWAIGTDEFKESAKALLLECISADPENLMAINTLAGMGILTADDGLVDAALSEILALPLEQRQTLDPRRDVGYLLIRHHLGQGETVQALQQAQKSLFIEPARNQLRRDLATLTIQTGMPTSAHALLSGAAADTSITDLRETLALTAVAEAMVITERENGTPEGKRQLEKVSKIAQKNIMLTPWRRRNWEVLAYVRASMQ
ncbi:hypothetical protein SERLA73DRAFT_159810 [Serpula lacrymans var. lacrymans S7.3]|uniref:Superkiller protein 3 n=1 Tax=Serpula lacrymans var. lacrymans (strain S7.3) TaxID=936435 RepID=F8PVV3_SERL3|nr:hypothetical protein SERLA73DRAFT_159810 [Serpula lacrymans var. lacrymans S7.3]